MLAVAAILGTGLFVLMVARPLFAACLFLALNPLIVGMDRGGLVEDVRLNELLLIAVAAALGVRLLLVMLSRRFTGFRLGRVEVAVVLLVLAGSVLPLLFRLGRGLPLTEDDLLYSLVLPKYLVLFVAFRMAVRTEREVELCLKVALASAAIAGLVGMMQVAQLFGVPEFLHAHYQQPFEGRTTVIVHRGTSTIGSSFGYADLMILCFLIAMAMFRLNPRGNWIMAPASLVFLGGCLASAAFSGLIGLAVAIVTFGLLFGYLGRMTALAVPGVLVAAAAFWPAIEVRLAGFSSPSGLPHSWVGRVENIVVFFLPELNSGLNWLLGVRPAARLPAPESWRNWVYIESGYIWLIWIGGLPFLLAFLWFAAVSLRHFLKLLRERADAIGVAATAGYCYMVVLLVLMLLDPHLTVRGAADLFFPLLALALTRAPVAAPAAALFPPSAPRALRFQRAGNGGDIRPA